MKYMILATACLLIIPSCSLRKDKNQKTLHTKSKARNAPPIISDEEAAALVAK